MRPRALRVHKPRFWTHRPAEPRHAGDRALDVSIEPPRRHLPASRCAFCTCPQAQARRTVRAASRDTEKTSSPRPGPCYASPCKEAPEATASAAERAVSPGAPCGTGAPGGEGAASLRWGASESVYTGILRCCGSPRGADALGSACSRPPGLGLPQAAQSAPADAPATRARAALPLPSSQPSAAPAPHASAATVRGPVRFKGRRGAAPPGAGDPPASHPAPMGRFAIPTQQKTEPS
mmetsp:Transcript_30091/g.58014  ORF Transcript_30091/g.58014 Transcript_30091/m.58014 type:complete len:236 (+) Transcript_30091:312-1019(+)